MKWLILIIIFLIPLQSMAIERDNWEFFTQEQRDFLENIIKEFNLDNRDDVIITAWNFGFYTYGEEKRIEGFEGLHVPHEITESGKVEIPIKPSDDFDYFKRTVVHEVGHLLFNDKVLKEEIKVPEAITEYGKTNELENIAEHFAEWYFDRDAYSKKSTEFRDLSMEFQKGKFIPKQQTSKINRALVRKIETTNPNLKANQSFVNGLFKAYHLRDANKEELKKFNQMPIGKLRDAIRKGSPLKDEIEAIKKEVTQYPSLFKETSIMANQFYRRGKDIFEAGTGRYISATEWKTFSKGATEVAAPPTAKEREEVKKKAVEKPSISQPENKQEIQQQPQNFVTPEQQQQQQIQEAGSISKGMLIKTPTKPTVYLINERGNRISISNENTYKQLTGGLDWSKIKIVSDDAIRFIPEIGTPINESNVAQYQHLISTSPVSSTPDPMAEFKTFLEKQAKDKETKDEEQKTKDKEAADQKKQQEQTAKEAQEAEDKAIKEIQDAIDAGTIPPDIGNLWKQLVQSYPAGMEVNPIEIINAFTKIEKETLDPKFRFLVQSTKEDVQFSFNLIEEQRRLEQDVENLKEKGITQYGSDVEKQRNIELRSEELQSQGLIESEATLTAQREIEKEQELFTSEGRYRQAIGNLEARGLTFSGEAIRLLGKRSAFTEEAGTPLSMPELPEGDIGTQNRLIASSSELRFKAQQKELERQKKAQGINSELSALQQQQRLDEAVRQTEALRISRGQSTSAQSQRLRELSRRGEEALGTTGLQGITGLTPTTAGGVTTKGSIEEQRQAARGGVLRSLIGQYETKQENLTNLNFNIPSI